MESPDEPYTQAELHSQRLALVREIPAWLVANDPHNPSRRRATVREVRRITGENYVADDLDDDVEWILSHDLGLRLPIVALLDEPARFNLVLLAADVACVGTGVSASDAQFIELLGAGLNLEETSVAEVVVIAVRNEQLRAA